MPPTNLLKHNVSTAILSAEEEAGKRGVGRCGRCVHGPDIQTFLVGPQPVEVELLQVRQGLSHGIHHCGHQSAKPQVATSSCTMHSWWCDEKQMSEEPTVETLLQGTRSRTKIASDALAIEMELKILYGEGKNQQCLLKWNPWFLNTFSFLFRPLLCGGERWAFLDKPILRTLVTLHPHCPIDKLTFISERVLAPLLHTPPL